MNKNVPELRFTGFDGEWEELPLKKLLSFKNGINAPKEDYGKGVKFINVLDILENDFITYDCINDSVEVTNKQFQSYSVNYGDVLFQRSSETREEVGTSNVYLDREKECVFGGFVIRGKKIGEYEPFFLKELLKSATVRKEITSRSGGSTRYNIGQESLQKVKVIMPPITEQKKITSFLSKVDEKIGKLEEKQQLWETYKKGIMQQIFNQKLRFKDENGEDYPDWEEKKLGDIFKERKEKGFEDLELLSVTLEKGVIKREEIEAKDNSNGDKSNYKRVLPNDIAYNSMRMWQGASGVSSYEGIVSPAYTILIPTKKVHPLCVAYYFKTFKMIFEFKKYSQGLTSDTWNLKYPLLSQIKIKIPSLPEQTKIANFLSAIEKRIEEVNKELELNNEFKKGLLQKMFC